MESVRITCLSSNSTLVYNYYELVKGHFIFIFMRYLDFGMLLENRGVFLKFVLSFKNWILTCFSYCFSTSPFFYNIILHKGAENNHYIYVALHFVNPFNTWFWYLFAFELFKKLGVVYLSCLFWELGC